MGGFGLCRMTSGEFRFVQQNESIVAYYKYIHSTNITTLRLANKSHIHQVILLFQS